MAHDGESGPEWQRVYSPMAGATLSTPAWCGVAVWDRVTLWGWQDPSLPMQSLLYPKNV